MRHNLSLPPEASHWPSGEKAIEAIFSLTGPRRVTSRKFSGSQMRTVLSPEAVANRVPSGLQAQATILQPWPESSPINSLVPACQILTRLSAPPVATIKPSGWKAVDSTCWPWAAHRPLNPFLASHTTKSGPTPATIQRPIGLMEAGKGSIGTSRGWKMRISTKGKAVKTNMIRTATVSRYSGFVPVIRQRISHVAVSTAPARAPIQGESANCSSFCFSDVATVLRGASFGSSTKGSGWF